MEYIYTALLLNSAGQEINESNVKKVMTAAGAKADESRVKSLVASLEGVDIKEAISKAVPVAAAAAEAPKKEEKEEKKEGVSEVEASAGLGSLFG